MALEVYSAAKPAIRYRATVLSLAGFALVSSLAGGLTWVRKASPLGPRFEPRGWGISIQLPRLFNAGRASLGGVGPTIEFQAALDDETSIGFTLHQIPIRRGETIENACHLAVREEGGLLSLIQLFNPPSFTTSPSSMGGITGTELHDPVSGTYVRGVIVESGRVFCVSIRTFGGPISDQTYALFDASCDSVRFDSRE